MSHLKMIHSPHCLAIVIATVLLAVGSGVQPAQAGRLSYLASRDGGSSGTTEQPASQDATGDPGSQTAEGEDSGEGDEVLVGGETNLIGPPPSVQIYQYEGTGTLYGVDDFGGMQRLFAYNLDSGVLDIIGMTGVQPLIGLGSTADGRILAVDTQAELDGTRKVYELSKTDGSASVLTDLMIPEAFFEGGLSVDPTTGLAYAVSGGDLIEINLNTGDSTTTSLLGLDVQGTPNIDGLAFDENGNLFGIATIQTGELSNHLLQISLDDGMVEDLGDVGLNIGEVAGLAYSTEEQMLLLAVSQAADAELGTPDLDGIFALTADDPLAIALNADIAQQFVDQEIFEISGLTFVANTVIPEPSTLALIGLGGLAILRRRRSVRR